MTERELVALGDHVDLLTGFPFTSRDYADEGVRLLRGDNVAQGTLRWDAAKYWPEALLRGAEDYHLVAGDVVLAMDRPWISAGLKFAPLRPGDLPALLVQRVARLRARRNLDQGFLLCVIGSPAFTDHVLAVQTGTAVPHISAEQIREFKFALPPLTEQRAIAEVLGALGDKVDANGRALVVVRQLLSALYDEITVAAGAAGWRASTLGEELDVLETGKRPSGGVAQYTAGVPSLGAESVTALAAYDYTKTKYVPLEFFQTLKRGIVHDLDVLLYKDGGRPGEFEPHVSLLGNGFPFDRFCINEHAYRLRARPPLTQEYLYCWLSSEPTLEEMRRRGTGVAIPGLNSTAVKGLPIIVPPTELLTTFSNRAAPLVELALEKAREGRVLAQLRDTLLPPLVSGELRVRDADSLVSEAV